MSGPSLTRVVLRVETPPCAWCRIVTCEHPEADVRVLQHLPLPDGGVLEEVEVRGADPDDLLETLGSRETVLHVDLLRCRGDAVLLRLHFRAEGCGLARAAAASGAAPRFPFRVADGHDEWTLVASRAGCRAFCDALQEAGVAFEVRRTGALPTEDVLTDRQREVLDRAVEAGFYDYPRRTNLTELAQDLGVVKSTLSQMLMQIEQAVFGRLCSDGVVALDQLLPDEVGDG